MTERTWYSVSQASDYTTRSKTTILGALRSGELTGYQPARRNDDGELVTAGGHWAIHRDDLDAWMRGETPVQTPAVCRPRRRKAS